MTDTLLDAKGSTLNLLVTLVGRRRRPSVHGEPPTAEELAWLLQAATTVPDHGTLRPWRFVVITGDARHRLGEALAADVVEARGPSPDAVVEKARQKAFAAPTLIALIASPVPASKVPVWEQLCSASCCGYAVVLGAQALGLGAIWKSTPFRDGPALRELLQLDGSEQLLGWVNVGGSEDQEAPGLRSAPDLSEVVTVLGDADLDRYQPPAEVP